MSVSSAKVIETYFWGSASTDAEGMVFVSYTECLALNRVRGIPPSARIDKGIR
jgi:hypothetical protein